MEDEYNEEMIYAKLYQMELEKKKLEE